MASTTRSGAAADPYVVGGEDGEAIWFMDVLVRVKTGAADSGGSMTLLDHLAPPGFETPFHRHNAEDETFYVLEGSIECRSGDEGHDRTTAGPGDTVWLPRGTPHGFRVVGDDPCRMLIVLTPGGLEGFFSAAGEPAPSLTLPPKSEPDVEALTALAKPYDLDILGPLPQ